MGGFLFPLCGKFNSKYTIEKTYHADIGLLPFVITPMSEELLLYSAQRMGLIDTIYFEDYLSIDGFYKLISMPGCIDVPVNTIEIHPAYYVNYTHIKFFMKEGPIHHSLYFELSDSGSWHVVKHWLNFHDVFVILRGRMLSFEESLEVLQHNERSYGYLNNGGPAPERIIKQSVFKHVVKPKRCRAVGRI